MESTGEKIRRLCREKGITQAELAERAELSYNAVKVAINSSVKTREITIAKIAKALEVEIQEIASQYVDKEPETIGERVWRVCKNKGTTIVELAKKSGLSEPTIRNVIKNRHKAMKSTLKEIAGALEIEIQVLDPEYSEESMEQPAKKQKKKSGKEPETVGERIKALCKSKGMTQRELAKKAGLSETTISNIINDRFKAKKNTAVKIANALEVEVQKIMQEYTEREPEKKPETVGERIKALCKSKGMTQRELAKKAGLSEKTIGNIINRNTRVKDITIAKIIKALEVEVQEVFPTYYSKQPETVGEQIWELCKKKGITKGEFAKKTGLSNSIISEIIVGKHDPRLSTLEKIANALEVEIRELFPTK